MTAFFPLFRSFCLRLPTWLCVAALGLVVAWGARPIDAPAQPSDADPLRVAVVADAGPAADSLTARLQSEAERLFAGRQPVRFRVEQTRADGSQDAVRRSVERAARGEQGEAADALIVVGPAAMSAACMQAPALSVPVVAVSTGSGWLAPSGGNECTVAGPVGWPGSSMRAFQRITAFSSMTVAVDARVLDRVPGAERRIRERADEAGVRVTVTPLGPGGTLPGPGPAGPVFLDHVDRLPAQRVEAFAKAMRERQRPVFAHDATYARKHGALAAPADLSRLRARQAALALESIAAGSGPEPQEPDAPTLGERESRAEEDASLGTSLVVNRAAASALGIELSMDVLVSAQLVETGASPSGEPSAGASSGLTLGAAMQKSIQSNLRLKARRQSVDAAANEVDAARAELLPEVRATASGELVSEDLASASLGSNPEQQVSAGLSLRQVLFSEPAFARLSVERRMQAVREYRKESVRLDAARQAGEAYLRVLQARSAVAIQRENVQAVRANLQAAQSRREAGEAGPREVSRLETALAQAEQGLIRAMGRERSAEIAFNRVLDRPLDAAVQLDAVAGVDPEPMLRTFPYGEVLDEPGRRDAFSRFFVTEARERAPEVQAVERLVSAQKRRLTSANRSFWMPTISLEGRLSQRMYEGGVGTSPPDLSLPGGGPSPIPSPPDQQWSVGVTASFPLFRGTERAARRRQASDRLEATRTERAIAELGVEQDVRTSLVDLETAHASVERALRAADAAQRTLDVTQAAYREGTASLLDLIDAQNNALATRQRASEAAFELLSDWLAVQRAAGSFRVLRTPTEQREFEDRLESALRASR